MRLVRVDRMPQVSLRPARNCVPSFASPACWLLLQLREVDGVFSGWEAVVLGSNVVLRCGESWARGEFPEGAVGTRVCSSRLVFTGCFSPRACGDLSLISLLMRQPFNVARNYTPRCLLLLFVLMLPVLKAHKNTSLLDTFYTTKKKSTFNPATYNMVTIAWSNCNDSFIIYWGHIQEKPWCNFVLAALGDLYLL